MRKTMGLAGLVVVLTTAALADVPPPTPPLTLHRAEGAIRIDGDLSDPGWHNAAVIDKFYETSPGDNIPAKVKTIVYLTYDDHSFYIGIRCEDPDPRKIRAPYVDRDAVIGTISSTTPRQRLIPAGGAQNIASPSPHCATRVTIRKHGTS